MNIGTVKKYTENREARFLSSLIWLKLSVFTICLMLVVIGFLMGAPSYWLIVIACAASIDLWSGARALEQARMDFTSFAQANYLFAAFRLPLALMGVFFGNAILVAAALYIGPLVAVAFVKWRGTAVHVGKLDQKTIGEVLRYALLAYISATLYTVAIYYPQFVISQRLDATAVATFGILLIYLGPLILLNASLRIYLLPLVAGNAIRRSDIYNNPKFMVALLGLLAAAGIGLSLASVLIAKIYGVKYPGIGPLFMIFIGLNFLCLLLGEFNIEVHRLGRADVEACFNAIRLTLLVTVLWLFGRDLWSIVILSSLTMLACEFALFIVVGALARREAAVSGARNPAAGTPEAL